MAIDTQEGQAFYEQNNLFVAGLTDTEEDLIDQYAGHHSGGLMVLYRDLGNGWHVKAHDTWGPGTPDEPGNLVVHRYHADMLKDVYESGEPIGVWYHTDGKEALQHFIRMDAPDVIEQATMVEQGILAELPGGPFAVTGPNSLHSPGPDSVRDARRETEANTVGSLPTSVLYPGADESQVNRIMLVAVELSSHDLDEADMTLSDIAESFRGKFNPDTIYDNEGNPIRGRFLGLGEVTESLEAFLAATEVGLEGAEDMGYTNRVIDEAGVALTMLKQDALLTPRGLTGRRLPYLTLGELRRKTAHLSDDMPITAGGIGDKTEEWLNVDLPDSHVPKVYDPSGEKDDTISLVLELREDFDTRQW